MIRHIAMFTFKPDAPDTAAQSLEEGLFLLAQTITEIAAYTYGSDLGLRDGNYDFAVVADFENDEDFKTYADHPDHQAFIQDRIVPILEKRVSLQFEI